MIEANNLALRDLEAKLESQLAKHQVFYDAKARELEDERDSIRLRSDQTLGKKQMRLEEEYKTKSEALVSDLKVYLRTSLVRDF